jgi:hypothetical protein
MVQTESMHDILNFNPGHETTDRINFLTTIGQLRHSPKTVLQNTKLHRINK